jgi:hypothetical protein
METATLTDWHVSWNKIFLLEKYLKQSTFDICVFIDADMFIANQCLKIEGIIDRYPQAVLVCDDTMNGSILNTGSIIARRSAWTLELLKRIREVAESLDMKHNAFHEQTCMQHLFKNDEDVRDNVSIMPMRVLNSYWQDCDDPQKHDVYHIMARPVEEKREKARKLFDACEI